MIRGMAGGAGLLGVLIDAHQAERDRATLRSIRKVMENETSIGTPRPPKPARQVPLLSTMPPQIKPNVRPPADPALAEFMRDLPQAIISRQDATRIAAKLENEPKIGLWQGAVVRTISQLEPNEFIYAFTWNAHLITMNINSHKKNYFEGHGVAFFSDARFIFYKDHLNILEVPLEDIYTVGAHSGSFNEGIAFRTQEREVQLTFAGEIDRELFRDMVIHIASVAACPQPDGAENAGPQVCECPGCASSVIIHPGTVNKCGYCDRLVEKREIPAAAPVSAPVSAKEEIDKLRVLFKGGILTEAEFEDAKNRLLKRA